jgi:hypothetical protein
VSRIIKSSYTWTRNSSLAALVVTNIIHQPLCHRLLQYSSRTIYNVVTRHVQPVPLYRPSEALYHYATLLRCRSSRRSDLVDRPQMRCPVILVEKVGSVSVSAKVWIDGSIPEEIRQYLFSVVVFLGCRPDIASHVKSSLLMRLES